MKKKNLLLFIGLLTASIVVSDYSFNKMGKTNLVDIKSINPEPQSINNSKTIKQTSNSMANTAMYYVLSFIKH